MAAPVGASSPARLQWPALNTAHPLPSPNLSRKCVAADSLLHLCRTARQGFFSPDKKWNKTDAGSPTISKRTGGSAQRGAANESGHPKLYAPTHFILRFGPEERCTEVGHVSK
jgi:hypothetical protein